MKRFCTILLLATVFSITVSTTTNAQSRLSIYIDNANRYASVELSDFCDRLSIEYNTNNRVLENYYRYCGYNWGEVSLVFELARTLGISPKRVLAYYKRYRPYGWDRIIAEIGIYPGSPYYNPFNDRIIVYNNYWCEHYNNYYAHRHHPRPPHNPGWGARPPQPPKPRDHHNHPPPPRKPNDRYMGPDNHRRPEYNGRRSDSGIAKEKYDKPGNNQRQDRYDSRDRDKGRYEKPGNKANNSSYGNKREGRSNSEQNTGGSKYRRR